MNNIFEKFKIPTLFGLGIILAGIVTGVILTLRGQSFISKASLDVTAQNITLSNISDTQVVISYQTAAPTISFITFGQDGPNEQTIQDDRDSGAPQPHTIHYITLKNLLPKTTYQYKIISGKIPSEINQFTTAGPLSTQTGFAPVIGSVLDGDQPLTEGIVYLSIADAQVLSAQIKTSGNFLIPNHQIRKADLSDIFPLTEELEAKLTVISDKGSVDALIKLNNLGNPLPPLRLGQNVDLTTLEPTPKPSTPSIQQLNKYDLNNDGKINAYDNALILQNFGKKGNNIPGDVNSDGVVDQKDLHLMAKQINQ